MEEALKLHKDCEGFSVNPFELRGASLQGFPHKNEMLCGS
jgi:hypothetical protein